MIRKIYPAQAIPTRIKPHNPAAGGLIHAHVSFSGTIAPLSIVSPRTLERMSAFDTRGITMGATLRFFLKSRSRDYTLVQLRLMNADSLDLESGYESECNNEHEDVIYGHFHLFQGMYQIPGLGRYQE